MTVNVGYKHSRSKEYFKEGRALRIETVINDTADLGVKRRLQHLPELQRKARHVNRRLLDHDHVGQEQVSAIAGRATPRTALRPRPLLLRPGTAPAQGADAPGTLEHTYVLIEEGQRFAVFYCTKVHNLLPRPSRSDKPSEPSTGQSPATSTTPESQPETSAQVSKSW